MVQTLELDNFIQDYFRDYNKLSSCTSGEWFLSFANNYPLEAKK